VHRVGFVTAWIGIACALLFTAAGFADVNLRKAKWRDVVVPGAFCGLDQRPIQLHGGSAFARRWGYGPPFIVEVDSGWDPVVYGFLGTNRSDPAAALVVDCNNGGGTAGGVMAYAQVIFGGAGKALRVIGVVTPRVQRSGQLPTTLTVEIRPGEVIAHEFWYGGTDGTCCPSGRAVTVWKYVDGRLRAGKPKITKTPKT